MSQPCVLAIDLGTSGPKVAVVRLDGTLAGIGQRTVATTFGPGGAAEQDPDVIWQATLDAAATALEQAANTDHWHRDDVIAVIASSQYSSIVPVDTTGTALHPMVLWMDGRGSPKRLKQIDGYPRTADLPHHQARSVRVHGLAPISGGMSLTHMRWFRYAKPDLYARTHAFLEPMDYLTARLTGTITANQCTAFMSLVVDNRSLNQTSYHPSLVSQSLVDPAKFPPLVPVGSTVGPLLPHIAEQLGLNANVVALSGTNDTQAGAIAAGAFTGTHAGFSLGSTGVLVTHLPSKKTDIRTSIYTVPSPLGDCHLLSAENGVAGIGLDYFVRSMVYPDDEFFTPAGDRDGFAIANSLAAAAPPGANGVMFLPWLRGSIAPKTDGRMRGGFLGVGLSTNRADFARAVMEGVAFNTRWLHDAVQRVADRRFTHLRFYGGGAQSDTWAQITADVLGIPVHPLRDARHANALGIALFAFERLGHLTHSDIEHGVPAHSVITPNPALRNFYDDRVDVFVNAFRQNRPVMSKLGARPPR
jgi:xylulokinase